MATQIEPATQTDENAFRAEVQQFLADNFPAELKGQSNALAGVDGPTNETPTQTKWREAVGARGWGTPTWPKEYGGGGLTKAQAKIIDQEFAKAGAYNPIGGMGVMMFGPTLLEYGNEAQKKEHIPPICRGEIRWCQGYSEPNAGSDLANLRTFAEDRKPLVGYDKQSPNFFWLAGQGGFGVQTSPGLGRLASELILNRELVPPNIDVNRYSD